MAIIEIETHTIKYSELEQQLLKTAFTKIESILDEMIDENSNTVDNIYYNINEELEKFVSSLSDVVFSESNDETHFFLSEMLDTLRDTIESHHEDYTSIDVIKHLKTNIINVVRYMSSFEPIKKRKEDNLDDMIKDDPLDDYM